MPDRVFRALLVMGGLAVPLGLWLLLSAGAASGSLYPAYSSLRTDANGTSILYESLRGFRQIEVSRSFQPFERTHADRATLLIAGVRLTGDGVADYQLVNECERLAKAGDRVIVALDAAVASVRAPAESKWGPLEQLGTRVIWQREGGKWTIVFRPNNSWKILRQKIVRQKDVGAVAMEKRAGSGSLVFAASSEAFKNNEMLRARDSELLVALLGPDKRIIFEESHLGVVETGSVLGLARHYHLQGFVAGLLILCVLFLWRSASAFPPRREQVPPAARAEDPLSGLARLLQRSLPQGDLIAECRRARTQVDVNAARNRRLEEVGQDAREEQDPVRFFGRLQDALHGKQAKAVTR